MKRWFQALFIMGALVGMWWFMPSPSTPMASKDEPVSGLQRVPAAETKSPERPLVLAPEVTQSRRSPAAHAAKLPEDEAPVDPMRAPLVSKKRRWNFLSGVVAIPITQEGRPTDPVGEFSGYYFVNSADVPNGVEPLPLVRREDNGLVGIFTGVIRAVGERGNTPGSFQSECPQGQIQESYEGLRSYLLKAPSDAQEYFDCLSNLHRFKSLEWEILDHPRGHR